MTLKKDVLKLLGYKRPAVRRKKRPDERILGVDEELRVLLG